MPGLFFGFRFGLRQSSFHWIISIGVISGIGRKWNRCDSAYDSDFRFSLGLKRFDSDSVASENQLRLYTSMSVHGIGRQYVKASQAAAIGRLLISTHPPYPWMNEVLVLHAYHSLMALYTHEHETGRQHVKAPQAAPISRLLISSHPPHPWMNLWHWGWSQPEFDAMYVLSSDETAISTRSTESREGVVTI